MAISHYTTENLNRFEFKLPADFYWLAGKEAVAFVRRESQSLISFHRFNLPPRCFPKISKEQSRKN